MSVTVLDADLELVASFDGTAIATYLTGADGARPPLLVVSPIGAKTGAWDASLFDVARGRRLLAWDHRGLHESGPPASDRIDPGAHAEDAIAAADHHGIDEFALVAWSNGSRIAFEVASRYPDRTRALIVVCGAYGYPLTRTVRRLELSPLLAPVAGIAKHFASSLQGPFRAFVARPELAGLIRQSGMIGPTADIGALVELTRGLAECDLRRLLAVFEAVAGDSAYDLLSDIHVPTLLIAGDHDRFVPANLVTATKEQLPQARMAIYERASHYLPLEFPARLSGDLRTFLDQYGI